MTTITIAGRTLTVEQCHTLIGALEFTRDADHRLLEQQGDPAGVRRQQIETLDDLLHMTSTVTTLETPSPR